PVTRCYPVNERDLVRHPKSYRASRQLMPGRKMRKTRIWDHEAIEKNPGAWETPVPDSGMRPGETNTEWRLRSLLRALQAWAAERAGLDRGPTTRERGPTCDGLRPRTAATAFDVA